MTPTGGYTLADPVLPLDPESAARTLGTALARGHAEPAPAGPALTLAAAISQIEPMADEGAMLLETGPYAGRTRAGLAEIAADVVTALPATDDAMVAVRPGLTLAHCHLTGAGDVEFGPPAVAGDRHLDLAAAATGLIERYGPAVVAPMLDSYGMDSVDLRRLDAAQLVIALIGAWSTAP